MLASGFTMPSLGAIVVITIIIAFTGFVLYVFLVESRKEEARDKYVDELIKRDKHGDPHHTVSKPSKTPS